MQFNLSIFTGNKFCLFNYATVSTGGFVDFDWFRIDMPTRSGVTPDEDHSHNNIGHSFLLGQNYPNPFNPTTIISYQMPVSGHVTLKVYDVLGREVITLVNDQKPAGSYILDWNASNLPTSVYFYRLSTGCFIATRKLMIVK
jgi:hypothetical protein